MTADEMFAKLGYKKNLEYTDEHWVRYQNQKKYKEIYIDLDNKYISAYIYESPCGLTFDELTTVNQCIKENS